VHIVCIACRQIVTQDFLQESSECVDIIRSSWDAINRIGSTTTGLERLTSLFKLCTPLKSIDELKNWLVDMYGNIAMVDYPYPTSFLAELPAYPARVFCANVTSSALKTSNDDTDIVQRIVKGTNVFFNYTGHTECFDTDSQGQLNSSDTTRLLHTIDQVQTMMCI
jgi:lysosomal Pro-X carboxypeptidase